MRNDYVHRLQFRLFAAASHRFHSLVSADGFCALSNVRSDRRQNPVSQQPEQCSKKKVSKNKEKKLAKKLAHGETVEKLFHNFYRAQYGNERWSTLYEALKQPARCCCMINKHAQKESVEAYLVEAPDCQRVPFLKIPCYLSTARFRPPKRDASNVINCYLLDASSVLAAQALDVRPNDSVLDMCAAPGGKSVTILQCLSEDGHLTANEVSSERRERLRRVIRGYVPERLADRVDVIGRNATDGCEYDRVLVDAPCSHERHLLNDESEFFKWTPKRSSKLARDQHAILSKALSALRVGGVCVYATCSVSSLENDSVMERILGTAKMPLEIERKEWPIGEPTRFGWIVLPDRSDNWGPMYFAALKHV